ncbi:MAG: DUF5663 domain-containing protein [Candidatus Saccharimonadales bacterium]
MNFTPEILAELNINLGEAEQASLLDELNSTLQERVGLAIFDLLDDNDAEALVALQEHGNDKVIADWITTNIPDYQEVVADEFNLLVMDLVDKAPALAA